MKPHIDIITLFPEAFPGVLTSSILGRSIEAGLVTVSVHDMRDWADNKHNRVDDRPFGGGPGMVLMPEPVASSVEAVDAMRSVKARRLTLAPTGRRVDQLFIEELSRCERILLVCGHYEGIDERAVEALGLEEVSIGDFVVSGGEIPAMLLIDAIARLQPSALGHEQSASEDSFSIHDDSGHPLLDCPHFTRPREWRDRAVPEVLLSGDHAAIATWRLQRSTERTRARRPDLFETGTRSHRTLI
ncbi:MAG: tRNA (guanosine(37)-N1)-methyltransferase TrmD [Planctomycetota bacterium]|nr:tRNA (guanosine(37)-N1)-methyltransferase TrmD [Planctomycetota bacterium]